jgi:hypothetical protein
MPTAFALSYSRRVMTIGSYSPPGYVEGSDDLGSIRITPESVPQPGSFEIGIRSSGFTPSASYFVGFCDLSTVDLASDERCEPRSFHPTTALSDGSLDTSLQLNVPSAGLLLFVVNQLDAREYEAKIVVVDG